LAGRTIQANDFAGKIGYVSIYISFQPCKFNF